MAERFEELDVWQRARGLANSIYDVSDAGSFARDFGLRDQMRRAAVSIMSNIAEGFESRTQGLFIDFWDVPKAPLASSGLSSTLPAIAGI